MDKVTLIYFSPTGTTQKILREIANGYTSGKIKEIDLTNNTQATTVTGTIIIGAPVYAGRLPEIFLERFSKIKIEGTKSILAITYGNREYEDALLELQNLTKEKGSTPISAGAFIAEHSLSTQQKPIAQGRPDAKDLHFAKKLGQKSSKKQTELNYSLPGNYPYKERRANTQILMKTDESKCSFCKQCIEVCPVQAIPKDNHLYTDGFICLRCCACIRTCKKEARKLEDDFSKSIAQWLYETCKKPKEAELFL